MREPGRESYAELAASGQNGDDQYSSTGVHGRCSANSLVVPAGQPIAWARMVTDEAVSSVDVPENMLATLRGLVGLIDHVFAGEGGELTLPQLRTLILIADLGPQRSIDLATALGLDPSTTSRLCTRLEARGLVMARRSRESKRELQIALTRAGRQLLDSVADGFPDEVRIALASVERNGTRR